MSPSDPPPEFGLSWRMREHEARLLADSLRTSRLTLLYAGAGASRSELLAQGVVPFLGRREADHRATGDRGDSRLVAPFIDRRDEDVPESTPAPRAEQVVYFSDWGHDPLPALLATVRAAMRGDAPPATPGERLADVLEAVCERQGVRLLIVLDAFEQFWATGSGTPEADRFVAAFGEAVDRPHLRVNFLLAVDDRWEGRLGALRHAVRGFDDSTVRLLGFERAGATAPLPAGSLKFAAPKPTPTPVASALPSVPALPPAPVDSLASKPAELPTLSDAVAAATMPPTLAALTASPPPPRPRRERRPKMPIASPVPIKTDGVYAFIESTLTQTADASEPWHDVDGRPPDAAAADRPRGAGREPPPPAAAPRDSAMPSTVEPPSPIDEWLDAAIAWCRRLLASR